MRAVVAALGLVLVLSACETVRPGEPAAGPETPPGAAPDALEARLLGLRLSPDTRALSALRAEIDRTAALADLPRQRRARVDALAAEAALLAGDTGSARRHLASAEALSDTDEEAWVVKALLETDPAKRPAVLEQGILKVPAAARLLCERGEAFLAAGRYAEAAQDLEEGLRGLVPGYAQLYGADRDRALALARVARDAGGAPLVAEGLDAPLTVRSMVERTASESRLLAGVSPDPATTYAALLPSLKTAGLLLDPAAAPEAPAVRKTVAWFLWGLVARAEHDPKLLTKYRLKYSASPVPDVAVSDPWFDAALGTVEREIMDLPDGVHFRPDDPVTGFELVGMLGSMKKLGME